jgi:hypothetical protein
MSTPVLSDGDPTQATMYAPPWAREGARDETRETQQAALRDAAIAAGENAVAASEQFRRTLPPATQFGERRARRRETPFEGDLAIMELRARPTLDPAAVPEPPPRPRGASAGVLARVAGAAGLAALVAFFMVGTAPLSLAVKAEGDGAPSLWARFTGKTARVSASESVPAPAAAAPLAERFAAVRPAEVAAAPIPTRAVQTVAIQVAPPEPAPVAVPVVVPPPPLRAPSRTLDNDEITILYKRSQDLITQGDIAGGRLLLTRAAEAGDARAALALGATYDVSVLGKLAVLGVVADAAKAKAWYAKAAELGSGEAVKRLEVLAHGR